MAKTPPKIVVPPPPSKAGKGSPWQQFVNYWGKKYPQFRQNAQAIYLAAKAEHIDPVMFGALVLNESGGNFAVGDSGKGAIGIGQLEPGTFIGPNAFNGGVLPWDPSHQVTDADLRNPAINVRLAAAYFGYLQGQFPADPYGRYNAGPNVSDAAAGEIQKGFLAKWVAPWNPKYVAGAGTSTAPPTPAGPQVPGGTAPQAPDIKDPWVVVKDGRITTVTAAQPPKNTLTYGTTPLTLSGYNSAWKQSYQDTFFAYTGRKAKPAEIQSILKNAPSVYALANELAGRPSFQASPVFKQHAPALLADARSIMGNTFNPPKGLISQAIAGNWDQATFEEKIRQLPTYASSVEYKTNYSRAEQTFMSVYGENPDPSVRGLLDEVTKQGWSQGQFQSWLMNQDAYKQTPSYQAKTMSFLSQLGLITGAVPTLTKDQVDQTLAAGDNLHIPGAYQAPPSGPAPSAAPGTTPQTPVDKPTGVGPTGFGG